jgi:hypothetical protein
MLLPLLAKRADLTKWVVTNSAPGRALPRYAMYIPPFTCSTLPVT